MLGSKTRMNSSKSEEVMGAREIKEPARDPELLWERPSVVLTTDAGGRSCYAALITAPLLENFNRIQLCEAQDKAKRRAIRRLNEKEEELSRMLSIIEKAQGAIDDTHTTQSKEDLVKGIQNKLEKIDSVRRCHKQDIEIAHHNITSRQGGIHEMLERALHSVDLISRPEISEVDSILSETDDQVEAEARKLESRSNPELELSEEEKAMDGAREDCSKALGHLRQTQQAFDEKEHQNCQILQQHEVAIAEGFANETRSTVELMNLRRCMLLTKDLIAAEQNFEAAKEHAEALGLQDGWEDESSFYGGFEESPDANLYPDLDADQVDREDFRDAISEIERLRIESWLSAVDEARSSTLMPDTGLDEWEFHEPEMHDSRSMVDFGPCGKRIRKWQEACKEQRRVSREAQERLV